MTNCLKLPLAVTQNFIEIKINTTVEDVGITEVPLFESGLDLETLRTKKVIAGVKEESAAYRAGLRDGQVIVKRSPIYIGDAAKQIEMTIKDNEGERTIKYYPASRNTVSVPEYKLRAGITDTERAETLRWLGVGFIKS